MEADNGPLEHYIRHFTNRQASFRFVWSWSGMKRRHFGETPHPESETCRTKTIENNIRAPPSLPCFSIQQSSTLSEDLQKPDLPAETGFVQPLQALLFAWMPMATRCFWASNMGPHASAPGNPLNLGQGVREPF